MTADDLERTREYGTLVVASPRDGEFDSGCVLRERTVGSAVNGHVTYGGGNEGDAKPRCNEAHERRGLGDFVDGARLEAASFACVLHGVVQDGSEMGGVGHEWFVLEQLEWDGF